MGDKGLRMMLLSMEEMYRDSPWPWEGIPVVKILSPIAVVGR